MSAGKIGAEARQGASKAFWCFISYKHDDNSCPGRQWASWLHQQIETFEVPADLAGSTNCRGEIIPPRIYPVFRDEEELPAYGDLSVVIVDAIRRSLNQIVICSASVRRSKFVDREVALFKSLGKSARTYGFIVSGSLRKADDDYCLPSPLVQEVDADGVLTERPASPLLIDARTDEGQEEWIDSEIRREELVKSGLDEAAALRASDRRTASLEDAKMAAIAAILGVEKERLIKSTRKTQSRKALRRAVAISFSGLAALAAAAYGSLLIIRANRAERSAITSIKASGAYLSQAKEVQEDLEKQQKLASELQAERDLNDALTFLSTGKHREAEALLRKNADLGHPSSCYHLATMGLKGLASAVDKAKSLELLAKAAEAGHPGAMSELGATLCGAGEAESVTRGLQLLRKAVAAGDSSAQLPLAMALRKVAHEESLEMLRRLSEKDLRAKQALAHELRNKEVSSPDRTNPSEWLKIMMEVALASPDANERNAVDEAFKTVCDEVFLKDGRLLRELDAEKIQSIVSRAIDAFKRDLNARQNLVHIVTSPQLRHYHAELHFEACRKAATSGLPEAMLLAAEELIVRTKNDYSGTSREAFKWLALSAKSHPVESARLSGKLHALLARTCPPEHQHEKQALQSFKRAAKSPEGDKSFYPQMAALAKKLGDEDDLSAIFRRDAAEGHIPSKRLLAENLISAGENPEEAKRLLKEAIASKDSQSAFVLGEWMMRHARTESQKKESLEMHLTGAELGNPACAHRAALAMLASAPNESQVAKAEKLLLMASEKGLTEAMIDLSARLERRPKSDSASQGEALAWLKLAQSRGANCEKKIAALERSLRPDALMKCSEQLNQLRIRILQADGPLPPSDAK